MRDTAGPGDGGVSGLGRVAYSPAEVARACGLSRKAIYRAIEHGELQAARVCGGSRLLISPEDLAAWMACSAVARDSSPRPDVDVAPRRVARTPLRDALQEGRAA
jgi:excisionase family DNA binding protein